MDVIIEFRASERAGVEGYRVNFAIRSMERNNRSQGIVGGVGFHYERCIRDPMRQNGCGDECFLQCLESGATSVGEHPGCSFTREASEGDCDVGITMDESPVEVGEAKERLDVLNLARRRPVQDYLDLILGHRKSGRR